MKKSDVAIIKKGIRFNDPHFERKFEIKNRLYDRAVELGLIEPPNLREAIIKKMNAQKGAGV